MDELNKNRLIAAGINVDEALERFMGSEAMFKRFMVKFLADVNYNGLIAAAEAEDTEEMIRTSHNLKGVCGNLAFNILFDLFNRQVQALRGGDLQAAIDLMPEIATEYDKVTSAIRENCM